MIRIDKLPLFCTVVLRIQGTSVRETVVFNGIVGTGEDRRAQFTSDFYGDAYSWEAYRWNGGWACGSSADRVSLVEVVEASADYSRVSAPAFEAEARKYGVEA